MANSKGKFIVFEGIDGSGKTTQIELLINDLQRQGKQVEMIHYPDYEKGIGKLIHDFLYKKYDFSPETQFLLYFADFIKDKEKIKQWLNQDKIVIADRYFTTTIAYQCLKGFTLEKALNIAQEFSLLKPDMVIYIDIPADIAIDRKFKEKGNLDRHEEDYQFLTNLRGVYKKLVANQVFAKWVVIDGAKEIKEVFNQVKKYA